MGSVNLDKVWKEVKYQTERYENMTEKSMDLKTSTIQ